jgi:hypothetical protein
MLRMYLRFDGFYRLSPDGNMLQGRDGNLDQNRLFVAALSSLTRCATVIR